MRFLLRLSRPTVLFLFWTQFLTRLLFTSCPCASARTWFARVGVRMAMRAVSLTLSLSCTRLPTGAWDVTPSTLWDGSLVTRTVVHTHSHPMSCSPSPRFVSSPGSRYDYYMAWLYNQVLAVLPDYSSNVLAEYRVSRGGRQFLVFSSGDFPVQSATGAPRHVRLRSALASSLKGSSHCAVHPGSRPVSFPGSGDPHVFPAQSGVPGIFPVPASTGLQTGVPDGSSLLVRAGYRISHLSVNAVSECRWYEFPENNCEDTEGEEGHCT